MATNKSVKITDEHKEKIFILCEDITGINFKDELQTGIKFYFNKQYCVVLISETNYGKNYYYTCLFFNSNELIKFAKERFIRCFESSELFSIYDYNNCKIIDIFNLREVKLIAETMSIKQLSLNKVTNTKFKLIKHCIKKGE